MQTNQPLITIVTVVYNGATAIEETILSVIQQTYSNIQYIIIDGGSSDSTLEIANRYRDKINIIISEPDNGIYDAMNKALKYANGEWINFMNCGDSFFSNNTIDKIFMRGIYTCVSIIYGNHQVLYGEQKILKYPLPLHSLWKRMTIQHQSTFVRTEILRARPFDTKYVYAADYEFMYDCYKKKKEIMYINETISKVSANGFSESNSLATYKDYRSVALKFEHNSLPLRLYYQYIYLKRVLIGLIKKTFPKLDKSRISLIASK